MKCGPNSSVLWHPCGTGLCWLKRCENATGALYPVTAHTMQDCDANTQCLKLMRAQLQQLRPQITLQTSRTTDLVDKKHASFHMSNNTQTTILPPFTMSAAALPYYPFVTSEETANRQKRRLVSSPAFAHHKPKARATLRATKRPTDHDSIILKAFPADWMPHISVDWASCGCRQNPKRVDISSMTS